MSRYTHKLTIHASQLPPPGEWANFPLGGHYDVLIENVLPVDAIEAELAPVIDIAEPEIEVEPEPQSEPEFKAKPLPTIDGFSTFAVVDVQGASTKWHAAGVHVGPKRTRRAKKTICKRARVDMDTRRTLLDLGQVQCDFCRRKLRNIGLLNEPHSDSAATPVA